MIRQVLYFAFLVPSVLFAQSWQWAKQEGGTGQDYISTVKVDLNGDAVTAGIFSGSANFSGTILNAQGCSKNLFIAKYNPSGNLLWIKQLVVVSTNDNVSVEDVVVDESNYIYATGYYSDKIIIGLDTLRSRGRKDGFITKLDAGGNVLWSLNVEGTSINFSNRLSQPFNGHFFSMGSYTDSLRIGSISAFPTSAVSAFYIAMIDTAGHAVWIKTGYAPYSAAYVMCGNQAGSCMLSGIFIDSLSIDNTTIYAGSGTEIFIASLDSSGNLMWLSQGGGSGSANYPVGIATDEAGSIYLSGKYSFPFIRFGSHVLPFASTNDFSGFLVKFDLTGNALWAKSLGTNSGDVDIKCISITNNLVYLTAYSTDSLKLNQATVPTVANGITTLECDTSGGFIRFAFVQMDSYPAFTAADLSNSFLIQAGTFQDSIHFDNNILHSSGSNDVYLAKYQFLNTWVNFPASGNPSTLTCFAVNNKLRIFMPEDLRKSELRITGMEGKIILQQRLNINMPEEGIDISSLSNGIYLCSIATDKNIVASRFIKIE